MNWVGLFFYPVHTNIEENLESVEVRMSASNLVADEVWKEIESTHTGLICG
jgi:hypothetical protein